VSGVEWGTGSFGGRIWVGYLRGRSLSSRSSFVVINIIQAVIKIIIANKEDCHAGIDDCSLN
jgi:hypothetical protein